MQQRPLGLVFGALVCPANVGERAGAMRLLESLKYPLRRLQKILVDKGFSGDDITQWVKDNGSVSHLLIEEK
jgi:putative transposase